MFNSFEAMGTLVGKLVRILIENKSNWNTDVLALDLERSQKRRPFIQSLSLIKWDILPRCNR